VLGILLAVVAGAFLVAIGGLFERFLMAGVLSALLGVDRRPCSSSWLIINFFNNFYYSCARRP